MNHNSNQSFDPDKHHVQQHSWYHHPKTTRQYVRYQNISDISYILWYCVYYIRILYYIIHHYTVFSIRYMYIYIIIYMLSYGQHDMRLSHYIWNTTTTTTTNNNNNNNNKLNNLDLQLSRNDFFQKYLNFFAKQRSRLLGNATSSSSPLILVILPTFPLSSGRLTTAVSFTVCPTSQPRWGAWPTPKRTWFWGSKTTFPKRLAAWWPISSQVWDGSTCEKNTKKLGTSRVHVNL